MGCVAKVLPDSPSAGHPTLMDTRALTRISFLICFAALGAFDSPPQRTTEGASSRIQLPSLDSSALQLAARVSRGDSGGLSVMHEAAK
jgi:hypothetical protein